MQALSLAMPSTSFWVCSMVSSTCTHWASCTGTLSVSGGVCGRGGATVEYVKHMMAALEGDIDMIGVTNVSACCIVCLQHLLCTVHDTEKLTFHSLPCGLSCNSHTAVRVCPHRQLADSVQNSADVICSRTDVLRLFVFAKIARIISSRISP